MIEDVQSIHDLLHRMQKEDPDYRVFGANGHEYLLGPVLSEDALQAFEQDHKVILPADYRFFLKHAGNGAPARNYDRASRAGAGPDYGLLPLEDAVRGADLSKSFPLEPSLPGEWIPGQEEWDKWNEEEPRPGLLEIVYSGCSFFSYLVVNGPAYGTVWDAELGSMDFCPTGLSFGEWYARWLDFLVERASPILARERIVEGIQAGMTKEQVISICGDQWEERTFGGEMPTLRFRHLATQFVLNDDNTVKRVVRHSISMKRGGWFDPD